MSRNPFDDPIQGDMIRYGSFGTLMVEGRTERKGWGQSVKFLILPDDGRRVRMNPRVWSLRSWKYMERNGALILHRAEDYVDPHMRLPGICLVKLGKGPWPDFARRTDDKPTPNGPEGGES